MAVHVKDPVRVGPPTRGRAARSTALQRVPIFYGWIMVATAFVTMGIVVNSRTVFSLFFPSILDEFGWSRAVTAAIFTTGLLAANAFTPFLGVLMDRLGPRVVFPTGLALMSLGLALATGAHAPWQLHLTLGVLVAGASVFVSYMGHALLLPNWFARQRGLAFGIAFSGVGVGAFVLLPWLQSLIGRMGWRGACWTLAALLALVVLPLNILVPRRRPEELGLRPDGDAAPGEARRAATVHVVDHRWAATEWTLARAVRTGRFWWIFVGYFTCLFAWYAVQVHQTKYLLELGFSSDFAAWALGIVGLTGIAGQILWGYVSDRIGREWAWTAGGAGFAVCYVALLALPAHPAKWLVYVMVAAQGLFGYGAASVFGAIPMELFQGARYGSIFAVLNVGSNAGAGAGPWVAGLAHDYTGSYAPAFWIAIGCSVVSVVAMWLAAPRKVRLVAGRVPR
jgi:MFS family permease